MEGRNENYDLCALARFYFDRLSWEGGRDTYVLVTRTPPTNEEIADALRLGSPDDEVKAYIEVLRAKLLPMLRGPLAAQTQTEALLDISDDRWSQEFQRLDYADKTRVALRWRRRVKRHIVKHMSPADAAKLLADLEDRRLIDPDFAVALDQEMEGLRNPQAMMQRIQTQINALQRAQQRWLEKSEEA